MGRRKRYNMSRAMREELLQQDFSDKFLKEILTTNRSFNHTQFVAMCVEYPEIFIGHLKISKNKMIYWMMQHNEIPSSFISHVYHNYDGEYAREASEMKMRCITHPNCSDQLKLLHNLSQ